MTTLTLKIIPREEIRMDQTPTQSRWALIPLYKLSATGNILSWQIGFDGVRNLEISQGYEDEGIQTSKLEVKLDNVAALREARHHYKLKYYEGYQPAGVITPSLVKGMKGYDYKPNSVKNWPVYTQPKLHGIRMLCQNMGRTISMRSWLNNSYTHINHIETELRDFFPYLPRHCTLDGELYNHSMDFSALTSAVKTTKLVHPRLSEVQYHIFDINYEDPEGAPFEKRCALLINAFRLYIQDKSQLAISEDISVLPKTFIIVPTQVARSHEEVIQQHSQFVSMGYEGIMIKKITNGAAPGSKEYNEALYRADKGNHILKYKEFIDEEAIIISVAQCIAHNLSTQAEGTVVLTVQDRRGNIFPIRMRGDFERGRDWFQNQDLVIGKEITIRYRELSIYGVPCIPVGIAIRDYE